MSRNWARVTRPCIAPPGGYVGDGGKGPIICLVFLYTDRNPETVVVSWQFLRGASVQRGTTRQSIDRSTCDHVQGIPGAVHEDSPVTTVNCTHVSVLSNHLRQNFRYFLLAHLPRGQNKRIEEKPWY